MKVEVNAKMITDALHRHYAGNSKYRLANAYIFKSDWESDFFVQKQNRYCYEFEVKISRGDFFADKKKVDKHMILANGKYVQQRSIWNNNHTSNEDKWIKQEKEVEHNTRPNKFFYVVPTGMITIDELPTYAGLITFDGHSINPVKEAPFIHKQKLDLSKVLVDKFQVFDAVYESNMSKLGDDGNPVKRADGKILKGPNYTEPDLDFLNDRPKGCFECGLLWKDCQCLPY